jgi:hypothetical protein
MKYKAADGNLIESDPNGPVTYSCSCPLDWANGTYESFETTSSIDNSIKQIRIIRVVNEGNVQITITERTQQEIEQYFQNLI